MHRPYGPTHMALLWPPAWEAQANAEGWTLHNAANVVEVDYLPPKSNPDEPIYTYLIGWLVLNAALGSAMHLTAWTFEYTSNAPIYDDGCVPGDAMHMVEEEDGSIMWVCETGGGWAR